MAVRNNKALGKGLNALFRKEPKDDEKNEVAEDRNFEFYGSLMKRYVQSGSKDQAIAQMLDDIREHLCISDEEHAHLLSTLQKREQARHDRDSKDNWRKAQDDLQGELSQMFSAFKGGGECKEEPPSIVSGGDAGGSEIPDSSEPIIIPGAIALMERNPTVLSEERVVISAPPYDNGPMDDPDKEIDGLPEIEDEMEEEDRVLPEPARFSVPWKVKPPAEVRKDGPDDLKVLVEEGRLDQALDLADMLLKEDPYSSSVLNEKGVALFQLGRLQDSILCYERGLALEPDSPELNINYALVLSRAGQIDRSLELLDHTIRMDPDNEEAWNNKAVVLTQVGRLRDALNCLEESIRLNRGSVTAWHNSGIILERMGEYGPASQCYDMVLSLDPDNDSAAKGKGYCLSKL